MNPSIDPFSQQLGEIIAKLEMVLRTQSEDRTASAIYRTEVRKELGALTVSVTDVKNRVNNNADEVAELRPEVEALDAAVGNLKNQVEKTADEVAELRPDVEDYRMRKHQAEGAGKLTKVLWAIFSAIGAGGIVALIELVRRGK